MKVLLANCVYRHGSTGKILYDTKKYLESIGNDVVIAYGRRQKPDKGERAVYKFCSEADGYFHKILSMIGALQYRGGYLATQRLIRIIEKEKPDVVHLHCMNGFCVNIYSLLKYLSRNKKKTIITHHAEFYYTGSCGHAYDCTQWIDSECRICSMVKESTCSLFFGQTHRAWKKMYGAINEFDKDKLLFTAVSPWVKDRAELSPIVNRYRCEVVMNGVETEIFNRVENRALLENRIKNLRSRIALFVTAEFRPYDKNHNKGGWYLISLADKMPDYTFVVVATHCEVMDTVPDNVFLWGKARNQQELAELYSSADVTLILSKRETFSMVCAESLCCGTPVVGFMAGGPESIAMKEYSSFCDYGDLNSLKVCIDDVCMKNIDHNVVSVAACERFCKESMAKAYFQLYRVISL